MKARCCGGEPRDSEAPLDTMLSAKVTLVTGITIGSAKQFEANEGLRIRARSTKKGRRKAIMSLYSLVAILELMNSENNKESKMEKQQSSTSKKHRAPT